MIPAVMATLKRCSRSRASTYGMQPERRPKQQPQRRSNSAKLSFEIYGAVWLRFVGKTVEEPRNASDFQAEYEGSIPFTRSNVFRHFSHHRSSILNRRLPLILFRYLLLFAPFAASAPRMRPDRSSV
jgi:hypothetical protein